MTVSSSFVGVQRQGCRRLRLVKQCQNCDNYVTEQFAKVFGDNNDEVYGCDECMTMTDVKSVGVHEPVPEEVLMA